MRKNWKESLARKTVTDWLGTILRTHDTELLSQNCINLLEANLEILGDEQCTGSSYELLHGQKKRGRKP